MSRINFDDRKYYYCQYILNYASQNFPRVVRIITTKCLLLLRIIYIIYTGLWHINRYIRFPVKIIAHSLMYLI